MKSNTGYKQMLRDRCPKTVSLALRWCHVKEAWLDHVYKNWIWIYSSKEERLKAAKRLLGYNDGKPRQFIFEDTIMWENLTSKEKEVWTNVKSWVSWFQKEYVYVENAYSISKRKGYDLTDIKREIMINHLYNMCPTAEDDTKTRKKKSAYLNKFVDFLIDCFEE